MDAELIVVGGGIGGTLAALGALVHGLSVIWIAPPLRPHDQSAHWHGYLHRGFFFDPAVEAGLIAGLGANWAFWSMPLLERFRLPIRPFAAAPSASWARAFARRVDSVVETDAVPWLPRGTTTVPTHEGVLDGPRFLAAAHGAAEEGVRVVPEHCTRIERFQDGWRLHTASGASWSAARAIVATGTAARDLLSDTELADVTSARVSRMLVLRGGLPPAAMIAPAKEAGGLFLASRVEPSGSAWLVSDSFSSPAGTEHDSLLSAWWACSLVERLDRIVGEKVLRDAVVGAYMASKSTLRTDDIRVPGEGVAVDATSTLACLAPSKWSNTPTSSSTALSALGWPTDWAAARAELAERIVRHDGSDHRVDETWQQTPSTVPIGELRAPGGATLRRAQSLFADAE